MKFYSGLKTVIVACLATLSVSLSVAPAQAQTPFFSHDSYTRIDPPFNSGYAKGSGWGENAVVEQIASVMSWQFHEDTMSLYITHDVQIFGNFTDTPSANSRRFDFLEFQGMMATGHLSLTRVTDEWEFQTAVSVYGYGRAGIVRNDEHTSLFGLYNYHSDAIGAIPTQSYSSLDILAPGHPPEFWDFSLYFGATYLATEPLRFVPTPGSLALLGLGGLAVARRRRT